MTEPKILQTNHGVAYMYHKKQQPIIGTDMQCAKSVVIIITETKKYCGFLSQELHKKHVYSVKHTSGRTFAVKRTDDIVYVPQSYFLTSLSIKPLNLSQIEENINSEKFAGISIDYEIAQICRWDHHGNLEVRYCDEKDNIIDSLTNMPISISDLTHRFQLKLYEYDNFNQDSEYVSQYMTQSPKLEYMLKKLWNLTKAELKLESKINDVKIKKPKTKKNKNRGMCNLL